MILFRPHGASISPDASTYLAWAKNLYNGFGYTDASGQLITYRGPIFSAAMAGIFYILGPSVESGVITVRLFWLFTIILVYFLGRLLFNRPVGIIASFLLITSGVMFIVFTSILTDGPAIFFVVLAQLLMFLSFEKQKTALFALSGLLLSIGFLTKQTAAFIFPLPILLLICVKQYRVKQNLKNIFVYIGAFISVLILWYAYLWAVQADPFRDLRVASFVLFNTSVSPTAGSTVSLLDRILTTLPNITSYISDGIKIFTRYYERDIAAFIFISPIFLIAWAFSVYRAVIKKDRFFIFLVLGLLLFLPLVPSEVDLQYGVRHNIYLYIISYLITSAFLYSLSEWFVKRVKKHNNQSLTYEICSFIGFILVSIQLLYGNYSLLSLISRPENKSIYGLNLLGREFFTSGMINGTTREIAVWLEKNTDSTSRLLTDVHWGNAFFFSKMNREHITIIDFNYSQSVDFTNSELIDRQPILFLWVYAGIEDPDNSRGMFGAVSEPQLLNSINKNNVNTVLLSSRSNFMYPYFKIHPAFEEAMRFDDIGVIIFKVVDVVRPLSSYADCDFEFPLWLGEGTTNYLLNLRESYPDRYKNLENMYFRNYLGFSSSDIERISSREQPVFDSIDPWGYAYTYGKMLESIDRNALERAVAQEEAYLERHPSYPWGHQNLSVFYYLLGDYYHGSQALQKFNSF